MYCAFQDNLLQDDDDIILLEDTHLNRDISRPSELPSTIMGMLKFSFGSKMNRYLFELSLKTSTCK